MKKLFLLALCCAVMMACGKGGQKTGDNANADASWQVDMGGGESTGESGRESASQQNAGEKKKEQEVVLDAYEKQRLSDLTNQFCMLKNQLGKKPSSTNPNAAAPSEEDLKKQMSDIASEMRTRVGKLQDQMRAAKKTNGEQWEDLISYLRLVEGY